MVPMPTQMMVSHGSPTGKACWNVTISVPTPLDETNPSPDNLPSRQDLKVSKPGSVLSTHDGFGRTTTPGSRVQFSQSLGSVSGLPMAGSDYTLIPPLP